MPIKVIQIPGNNTLSTIDFTIYFWYGYSREALFLFILLYYNEPLSKKENDVGRNKKQNNNNL